MTTATPARHANGRFANQYLADAGSTALPVEPPAGDLSFAWQAMTQVRELPQPETLDLAGFRDAVAAGLPGLDSHQVDELVDESLEDARLHRYCQELIDSGRFNAHARLVNTVGESHSAGVDLPGRHLSRYGYLPISSVSLAMARDITSRMRSARYSSDNQLRPQAEQDPWTMRNAEAPF